MLHQQLEKMIFGKEDLGLSLSLNFPEKQQTIVSISDPLQLNLNPCLNSSVSTSCHPFQLKSSWLETFPSSDQSMEEGARMKTNTFLKGIDVNRAADAEEDAGVSSPNSTLSTVSGKRSEREGNNNDIDREDQETERACSRGMSDEEDGDGSRKKLRLSKDQSAVLEESFKEHSTLNPKLKLALSKKLGLRPRQVEVWFQNRRARTKLKQTEVDCEYLKRCFENLTEENRRLQKEVQELRALKLSPQFYMQMTPPTTLTMCPSCERVTTAPPPPSSTPQPPPPPLPLMATTAVRPLAMLMPAGGGGGGGGAHPPAIAFNPWGPGVLHSRS